MELFEFNHGVKNMTEATGVSAEELRLLVKTMTHKVYIKSFNRSQIAEYLEDLVRREPMTIRVLSTFISMHFDDVVQKYLTQDEIKELVKKAEAKTG